MNFFKGALLADAHQILEKPGENCQATRVVRCTSVTQVRQLESILKDYIREAIEVERSGMKVDFKAKSELLLPAELEKKFDEAPAVRAAWEKLTPGRQRGYVLYFNAAKQSKTRESRIEKVAPWILEGRGMHD